MGLYPEFLYFEKAVQINMRLGMNTVSKFTRLITACFFPSGCCPMIPSAACLNVFVRSCADSEDQRRFTAGLRVLQSDKLYIILVFYGEDILINHYTQATVTLNPHKVLH